jgi:hypothetical protein
MKWFHPERHEYELYLAIEDIDHSRTKTKSFGAVRCPWDVNRTMSDFAVHLTAARLASGTPCQ